MALALASTVIWALYWIFNTRDRRDPVVGLFVNFLFSFPLVLGYYLLTSGLAAFTGLILVNLIHPGVGAQFAGVGDGSLPELTTATSRRVSASMRSLPSMPTTTVASWC